MSVAPGPGLRWLPRILKDPLASMVAASKEFGPVVRVPFGSRVNHLVTTPEHFQHVLAENAANYSKGRTFEKTRGYLGNGLSTSSGDFWRRQRRLMQPHFHKEAVRELATQRRFSYADVRHTLIWMVAPMPWRHGCHLPV